MSIRPFEASIEETQKKRGPGDMSGLAFTGQIRFYTDSPSAEFTLDGVLNRRDEETIKASLANARANKCLAQWIPALEAALVKIQLATRLGESAYMARSK
jgi:hypothetical protein